MTRRSARLTEGMCPPRAAVRPGAGELLPVSRNGQRECLRRASTTTRCCGERSEPAAGFVLKDAPAAEMLAAIRVTARGGAWLDPRVAERVLRVVRDQRAPDRGRVPRSTL